MIYALFRQITGKGEAHMFKNFFNRKGQSKESKKKDSAVDDFLRQILIDSFVKDALEEGHVEKQITISALTDYSDALLQAFEEQGWLLLDEQEFKERLHAVCPECGVRLTGEGILMVSMLKRFDNPVLGGGGAKTERILNGLCANEGCKSREIIIEWDG
jgi:hypothetical protein